MQIIVISDNHGNQDILKIIHHIYSSLYKENVIFLHLGDSQAKNMNDLNGYICVKGNNDNIELPKKQRIRILDKRIHFSHGDESYGEILNDIDCHHPDLYLVGHTHIVYQHMYKNCLILNPGSITLPRDSELGSFMVLTIDQDISFKVVRIQIEKLLSEYQCFIQYKGNH